MLLTDDTVTSGATRKEVDCEELGTIVVEIRRLAKCVTKHFSSSEEEDEGEEIEATSKKCTPTCNTEFTEEELKGTGLSHTARYVLIKGHCLHL